jgi:septum formation protein
MTIGGRRLREAPRETVTPPPLLLASSSPQRRDILAQLGIPFVVAHPRYEEHDPPGLGPEEAVVAHARGKAWSLAPDPAGRPILGVDTEVVLDGRVFGKPASPAEARVMLSALGGSEHRVLSGLCLLGEGFEELRYDVTAVRFRSLTRAEIDAYVETGEWEGRAGAYAIQRRGAALVERIDGDYLNVVGLPAALLVRILAARVPGLYGYG